MGLNLLLSITLTASLTAFFYFVIDDLGTRRKNTQKFKTKTVKEIVDRQVRKAVADKPKAKNILAQIEKMLLSSTVRVKNEPIPLFVFLAITLIFALSGLLAGVIALNNVAVGLVALILLGAAPYNLLAFDYLRNKKAIKNNTTNFLLVVSNLVGIYDDPIKAFKEVGKSFKNPLIRREINWFVSSIETGFSLEDTIKEVKSRVPDPVLKDFFDDLHFYMEYGGDLQENIISLIKKTYNRKMKESQKSTEANSVLIVVGLLTVFYFGILAFFAMGEPELMEFWVDSTMGKAGAFVMATVFLIVAFIVRSLVFSDEEGG